MRKRGEREMARIWERGTKDGWEGLKWKCHVGIYYVLCYYCMYVCIYMYICIYILL